MHSSLKSMAGKMLSLLGAGLLFYTGTASAQMFEGHYGAEECREGGRSVVPVEEGGYISVGLKSCGECGGNDIYVVRTHNHGNLFWSTTYDLGGNDVANSVKEVYNADGKPDGFIITGYTENLNSECGSINDAFLLRIDRCGKLIWVNTYGHPKTTESGQELVIATTGNDNYKTSPGDFVVAGWTTYEATDGNRNGYIFRTDANGNLIWDAVYEGPNRGDDYFLSIDEAIHEATDRTADIVVAGGTNSYGDDAGNQGWIVRVSGNDGRFWGNPHAAATYGGREFEELRSVRELKIGNAGELVATGVTKSYADNRDVYVVTTKPNPCDFIADRVFGDLRDLADEGFAIREINYDGNDFRAGYLIVTGYMTPQAGGFGGEDVFLQVLEPGTLNLVPQCVSFIYGGDANDRGLSVEPLRDNYPCRSQGFIVSGYTQSPNFIGADPQQLYLLKTDQDRIIDNCVEKYEVKCERPDWRHECKNPEVLKIGEYCRTRTEPKCHFEWKVFCFNALKTEYCKHEACELCPLKDEGAKRLTGTSESGESGVAALSSFPNPVKSGSAITLEYTLLKDATVTITVSDLSGRTVYNNNISGKPGAATTTVGTNGWASGSYMVSVSAGSKATTTRIVVTE